MGPEEIVIHFEACDPCREFWTRLPSIRTGIETFPQELSKLPLGCVTTYLPYWNNLPFFQNCNRVRIVFDFSPLGIRLGAGLIFARNGDQDFQRRQSSVRAGDDVGQPINLSYLKGSEDCAGWDRLGDRELKIRLVRNVSFPSACFRCLKPL
jgi:hypothetical protein